MARLLTLVYVIIYLFLSYDEIVFPLETFKTLFAL